MTPQKKSKLKKKKTRGSFESFSLKANFAFTKNYRYSQPKAKLMNNSTTNLKHKTEKVIYPFNIGSYGLSTR